MELNKVLIIGNLTRDPEMRDTPASQVVTMGLASNRRFGGRDGSERQEEVLFIDVEAWGKTAEHCQAYLRKGSQVLVEGRLRMNQWEAQDGTKRSKILIVADRVQFGAKPADEQQEQAAAPPRPRRATAGAGAAAAGRDDLGW